MRKIVLFDLDDMLYPEISFVKSGFRAVSEEIAGKYDGLSRDSVYHRLKELFYEDSRGVFNRFFNLEGIPYREEDIQDLVKLYREHKPRIEPYPETMGVLMKLKGMRCSLGILSDGYPPSQRNKIEALFHGKKSLIDKVMLTDELGREYHKPDERAFIVVKEFFQAEWDEMAYVGDNPRKDFYIGLKYPILTIRLKREDGIYLNSDYLEDIRENQTISSLSELPEIVKRL